jgi:hypothetical protein
MAVFQVSSREERTLLDTLAQSLAPALHVAQMVKAQQVQVRERERIEQELRTAQAIQHAFCPKTCLRYLDGSSRPTTNPRAKSVATSTISSRLQMAGWGS